jgi:hypothetical protein
MTVRYTFRPSLVLVPLSKQRRALPGSRSSTSSRLWSRLQDAPVMALGARWWPEGTAWRWHS